MPRPPPTALPSRTWTPPSAEEIESRRRCHCVHPEERPPPRIAFRCPGARRATKPASIVPPALPRKRTPTSSFLRVAHAPSAAAAFASMPSLAAPTQPAACQSPPRPARQQLHAHCRARLCPLRSQASPGGAVAHPACSQPHASASPFRPTASLPDDRTPRKLVCSNHGHLAVPLQLAPAWRTDEPISSSPSRLQSDPAFHRAPHPVAHANRLSVKPFPCKLLVRNCTAVTNAPTPPSCTNTSGTPTPRCPPYAPTSPDCARPHEVGEASQAHIPSRRPSRNTATAAHASRPPPKPSVSAASHRPSSPIG